jgi:hypothetical protein
VEGKGDSPINLAEAVAHILLEALHMHCQQGRTSAYHNVYVTTTTHFQIKSHTKGQFSTVTYSIIVKSFKSALAGQVAMYDSYAWVQLMNA